MLASSPITNTDVHWTARGSYGEGGKDSQVEAHTEITQAYLVFPNVLSNLRLPLPASRDVAQAWRHFASSVLTEVVPYPGSQSK
jgi:hypothetical protein